MAKQLLTLICETCGKKFEAHAYRRVVHCQECAEELRRNGLGPVQIKRRPVTNLIIGKSQARVISWEHSKRDLIYYLDRFDRFATYDGVMPSDPGHITDEDRRLANQIAARMSVDTWAQIVGQSIAQIGDWDLLNMNDFEWQSRRKVIHQVLGVLIGHTGIGVARLTKALHRKRPKLIPVCDSVVLIALGIRGGNKIDRIIACMDRLRIIGHKHMPSLQELRELSRQRRAEMAELRILEILYWVQLGPFPADNKSV